MKPQLVFGCIMLSNIALIAQSTDTILRSEDEKLDNITSRVRSGDYSALNEVSAFPAPIAVPYLEFWMRPLSTGQQRAAASEALGQVQGYADYIQQDMGKTTAEGVVPVSDFGLLEAIGTPEAAAVVAPYLFDFKTITPQEGDLMGDSNLFEALDTLTQMKLPGAPPPQSPQMSHSAYLIEWQRWAISKGFVPKEWSSRVGAPAWLARMDEVENAVPMPASTTRQSIGPTIPSSSAVANLPVPSNTLSLSPIAPSSPAAISSTSAPYARSRTTTWITLLVAAIILATCGIIAIARRK
jgi:hypothetical protein